MGSRVPDLQSEANPYISPNYSAEDWRRLALKDSSSPDWQPAVDIFWDRIDSRFLAPAAAMIKHVDPKVREFSGFAILAIDCLLIETLNQFHKGINETSGSHENAFWDFFRTSKYFHTEFDTKRKAQIFYSHFRCGILHQAQTKKLSRVRIGMPTMVQIPFGNIEKGLTIDRERFHQALVNEMQDYAKRLRTPVDESDYTARRNFVLKMSFITEKNLSGTDR